MQHIPFSELIKVRFLRNGSKGGGIKFYKKWGNTNDEKKVLELASTINLDKENALKEHLESKGVIVTNQMARRRLVLYRKTAIYKKKKFLWVTFLYPLHKPMKYIF